MAFDCSPRFSLRSNTLLGWIAAVALCLSADALHADPPLSGDGFNSAIVPPALAPASAPLEERLQRMEQLNEQFASELRRLSAENQNLASQLNAQTPAAGGAVGNSVVPPPQVAPIELEQPSDVLTDQPFDSLQPLSPLDEFAAALTWDTKDGEFTLELHSEMQVDIRAYDTPHSWPVNDFSYDLARARLIFNGQLTKPIDYSLSINKGLGSLDLLDAFVNFDYDSRFQVRIGRYRMPFTYDWYSLSNQFLPTPERSVFAMNYGYNRNTGIMLHGEILDGMSEYAIASTIGPRNAYFDTNSSKDILAYFNIRPFEHSPHFKPLKNLNVGASMAYGIQDQFPLPVSFRTSANASESGGAFENIPPFLVLNDNVIEDGLREQFEVHVAYYYKQLTVMAAWDHARNTYGFDDRGGSVRVPTQAWHVQFGYFLTGEEVTRRTFVQPKRPFDLRAGKRGPGAFELTARFENLSIGRELFDGGLADPNLWTNKVFTTDLGLNWHLNKFVKIYFDWQHCDYGNPVYYRPGRAKDDLNLFWTRFQTYF
ncbi:porin [Planctomicrobium sp. SH664]|uniref:porin n=1 Tax=Planctomicrobium sp. SH664 TaxID=3448125 RepID=UPI003F5B48FA